MPATAPRGPRLGADAARGGAAPAPAGGDRPRREPLRGLTVLYDPGCRLCRHVADWLARQRKLIPVRLVPVGSAQARRSFPALDHEGATRREITAVGDAGQVYIGENAWVVVLWALADHRALAHTMSTPAGRRLARAAVLGVAKYRVAQDVRDRDLPGRPQPPRGLPTSRPLWVYDPATGWTPRPGPATAPGTGCTDGCPPPG